MAAEQESASPVMHPAPELIREARQIDTSVEVDLPNSEPSRRMTIEISPMSVIKVMLLILAAYIVLRVWPLVTLLLLSAMFAAALSPFLALLERWGLPRPLAIAAIALTIIATIAFILVLVVPPLVAQTKDLIDNSDKYASELQGVLAGYGIHADIAHLVHTIPKHLGNFNGMLMTVAQVVFDGAIALATIVFVTIYMLSDQERLRHFFVGMFPERRRPQILAVMAELRRQVGGYVRGQLITSLLAGIFSFIVLEAAGVPNALALAGFAGIIDLVPMFGQMLGMIPAVGVALTVSPTRALIVLGGFVLYQQAENHFIVPRVYSNTMNVSPLVALVGLLIGAQLLGMLGMLVSLPIIASLPVILDFLGVHLHTERIRPNATADASEDLAVPG